MTRAYDTEVKILEYIAARFPRTATGRIRLFSEKPPCSSCGGSKTFEGVIQQFQKAFPNIELIVQHGG